MQSATIPTHTLDIFQVPVCGHQGYLWEVGRRWEGLLHNHIPPYAAYSPKDIN